MEPIAQVEPVTVLAVICNGKATLLDAQGKLLKRSVPCTKLAHVAEPEAATPFIWDLALNRAILRLYHRARRLNASPWDKKIDNLVCSFRLRGYDLKRIRCRKRTTCYPTTDWKSASKRMWHSADARNQRHTDSGWARWARTTSNNNNKRKGARYA